MLTNKTQEANNLINQRNNLTREITDLQQERDRIQGELGNLKTRLGRLQSKFLGSLFRSKKKSGAIKELKVQMVRLRAELIEKERQIEDLNQQLTLANNTIGTLHQELNQKDGEISRLEDRVKEVETERDSRPRIALDEWENDYSQRPARQELENIQRELDREKGWWDKWISDNITEWGNEPNHLSIMGGFAFKVHFQRHFLGRCQGIELITDGLNDKSRFFKEAFKNLIYEYYKNHGNNS
ncbi:protein of unknown function [endosymbiont DhMRE of Dentiscutata heterogama]|uniref:hypothetical protein n=1 Tax=endosymbiont DhMRE of Dentiscutata heterogama TaxID=1609546 RepID=UPI000629D43F|nr:hypothetical protein [endosymbiont DhMRE of Dentiscutata heterogama]CFW93039.1 protein of unknown function [endosymbiont DhMRE of Dentiscutata heterogama]